MEPVKKYASALLYCLPALAFFAAGSAKLAGVPQVVKPFVDMGLPAIFGLIIGLCEIAGAIGLIVPRTRLLAAMGLIAIMAGAIGYHLSFGEPSAVPAFVLLVLLVATIWQARKPSSSH